MFRQRDDQVGHEHRSERSGDQPQSAGNVPAREPSGWESTQLKTRAISWLATGSCDGHGWAGEGGGAGTSQPKMFPRSHSTENSWKLFMWVTVLEHGSQAVCLVSHSHVRRRENVSRERWQGAPGRLCQNSRWAWAGRRGVQASCIPELSSRGIGE